MAVEVGQVLDGKYRIIRLIGKGGMGAVYEAEHLLIDRRVAVKELHVEALAAENAVTRFEREARAAGRIGSDHILQIFDVGTLPDGARYMVSELLDGETLAGRLQRVTKLTPQALLPIAQQLLTGLAAAHSAGVLHRDLKPDNVFLVRSKSGLADFVKIIDFGIAKFQHASQDESLKMTKTGMVVGTPYYLSPEQARGTGEADARSDLYSVGVILYECVTGEVPFNALNFNDLIFKIVLENARPPVERTYGVDQRFSDIVLKAMARDPGARFQSAQELLSALSEWAGDTRPPSVAPRSQQLAPSFGGTLPIAGRSESGNPPGRVAFTPVSVPTPSSFGTTRNPQLSSDDLPIRKSALPMVLGLGGSLVVLIGGGLLALRLFQHDSPTAPESASASAAPASVVSAAGSPNTTAEPSHAPGEASAEGATKPTVEPAEDAPATSATSARTSVKERFVPKHSAPVTHTPVAVVAPPPPVTPPPAHAATAQPKHRGDWGY